MPKQQHFSTQPEVISLTTVATPPRKQEIVKSDCLASVQELRTYLAFALSSSIEDHCRYRAELLGSAQRAAETDCNHHVKDLVDTLFGLIDLYLQEAVPALMKSEVD